MYHTQYDYDVRLRREEDFVGPPLNLAQRLRSLALAIAPRPKLKLLDLSRYQAGEVQDVQAIKAAGYVGVILQATYGLHVDSSFAAFWPMFLDAGFVVMTYHMFYAGINGIDQAHNHLETIRLLWDAQGARYPAFNDIEIRDGILVPVRQMRAVNWRDEIDKEIVPGTYCSYALWQELMGNMGLGDQLGWCAAWNPYETFTLPVGWTAEQTLFRQIGVARKHDWVEAVPGMSGDVDVDVFYGALEDLYKLGDATPPPAPEPEPGGNMDIIEKLKAAKDGAVEIYTKADALAKTLEEAIAELEAAPPSTPPPSTPPPPASTDITIVIAADKDKALARFAVRFNDAGKPVMAIYPSDNSPTGERIQFLDGARLRALPAKVKADGGAGYWRLTGFHGRGGQVLYIREVDAVKA